MRSCLIDGEAVACDENWLAVFERLRHKPSGKHVFLYAFDLLELDGEDLRREPLETRKATLASLMRRPLLAQPGFQRRYKGRTLLPTHPQTLFDALPIDAAFDVEQRVDVLDRLP